MKILIIDGDAVSRNTLNDIIKSIGENIVIFEAGNIEDAFGIAMTNTINLFIVDIVLKPGKKNRDNSGASFILGIRGVAKYRYTPVIVISGVYDGGMFLYSHAHIYRYIEKPFNTELTKNIIKEALKFEEDIISWRPQKVMYQVDGILECIDINQIIYAKSNDHVMKIVTDKRNYTIPYLTCKKLLKDVDDRNFVTCFRGCIVNVKQIINIDKVNRYITMNNCSDKLEIGMKYKKELLEAFLHQSN